MSWIGDVFDFEKFNLGNIGKKIAKNPEQLLIGAGDPLTAGVWNGVLGTDYKPLVNEWGGATDDTYQKAQENGINTGPGKSMHGLAQGIAGLFAGNYGAGKLGGLLGNSSTGVGQAGNAGYGNYADPKWFNQANQSTLGTINPDGLTTASHMGGGEFYRAAEQNGLGTDNETLNKIVQRVNSGESVQQAAQNVKSSGGGGLLGGAKSAFGVFNQYAKPVSQGIGYAQQAQGLLGGQQQQPMQAPQLPQGGQVDVSGILGAQNQQQAQLEAQRAARRARQTGILGGYYG